MLNAASALRGRGPWVTNGGWEYPVVLATVGASITIATLLLRRPAATQPASASDELLGKAA